MSDSIHLLEKRLGYCFDNPELAVTALTHRSAGSDNNERLEFLGDAVLGLAIAETLYERRPGLAEGDLTRMRAHLVNRETLAELAIELNLGAFLTLGSGERRTGGEQRHSILEDALEAVIGAVFLDSGYAAARAMVQRLFAKRLKSLPGAEILKDPKTRLQERQQAQKLEIPVYTVVKHSGPEHARRFVCECRLVKPELSARGAGSSRRRAEQAAAAALLERLI